MTRTAARHPPGRGWLGGLACGAALSLTPGTALLVVALFMPTLLIRALDAEPGRGSTRAVLLCNLAGGIGAIVTLWGDGPPSIGQALDLLRVPATLLGAWSAAAAGWVGSELAAHFAYLWLDFGTRRIASQLDAEAGLLVAEWGEPDADAGDPSDAADPPRT